jgi:anaerobic magnesium-protoporphyrin IX monomethyl ester cyclase
MGRSARVMLVGYEDQDNLGLRYLSSRLRADGHLTRIEKFGKDPAGLINAVRDWSPDVVGFSLIFQYMAQDFAGVIRSLRADCGERIHITIGGHYPSFAPQSLFDLIPELDSVVRFEGEETLADLVTRIMRGESWHGVPGIAYHDGANTIVNPPRPGAVDLDTLSWPDRSDIQYSIQRLPTASILASRGCPWECSFCSITSFYRSNGSPGRRRRTPALVVDEIEHLVKNHDVRLILFQDDDFLAGGQAATDWAHEIAREITQRRLSEKMRFKISCRSDEIKREVLAPLVEAGLAHVYLGVEAGDADALLHLNKRITPDVHMRANRILRDLDLTFDFGFMLLEPWSTIKSVRNNLAFLREFCAGGYTTAGFCRTLPYVGTAMERRMRDEGRLFGPALEADYRFQDSRLDTLWDFSLAAFSGRNHGQNATWDILRAVLFEARLELNGRPHDKEYRSAVQALVHASNELLIDITGQAIDHIEATRDATAGDTYLVQIARLAREEDLRLRKDLSVLMGLHKYVSVA